LRPFNAGPVALLLTLVSACDGRGIPNSVSSATAPATIVLLGQVTDRTTSAPVSGAIVSLNGYQTAITDSSGNYSFGGWGTMTFVEADNYATDYRYIGGTPHNVHLYPIRRITAGDSTSVTVAPDDTLCVNNMQDSPELGPNYVCRSVRVVAPSAGVMTLEALSTTNGAPPLLEVEIVAGGSGPCCSERLENPTSIPVTAGTEVVAHVEVPVGSATSQSFTLNTSMRPR
jgi:hypothetical protein